MATWIMERRLRAQFERLLADASENGSPAGALRGRLAADFAEAMQPEKRPASGDEGNFEDLVRVAAYLDGRLSGTEREAFLGSLAANPRHRAELESAAALLSAIETESHTQPAQLFARAGSVFGPRTHDGKTVRHIFLARQRAIGWSLAILALLMFVPGGLFLFANRPDRPVPSETPSLHLETSAPPQDDQVIPRGPPAAPAQTFKPEPDRPAPSPDVARSISQPNACEEALSAPSGDRTAGKEPGSTESSASRAVPCPQSSDTNSAGVLDSHASDPKTGKTTQPSVSSPTSLPSIR